MQRELGDGLGGGNEGQEVDPRGFQSVVQDRVDLISWDGDLSAGGPPDNMPQVHKLWQNIKQVSLVLTMVEVEIVFCWMIWANLMLCG